MMVLRSFPLSFCYTASLFSSIINLVKSHRKPFSSMLVFVFHRAQGWQKFAKTAELLMTQMFKVQSVRSGPQLTFVPSTWQSSLCCQADLDWKTQGGESDMSQTLSAMAMMS